MRKALLWFFALQAAIVTVLVITDRIRKRRVGTPKGYAWERYPETQIEHTDDMLTLYTHGNVLYDDMVEAIEGARESILIETFIWKDDAAGLRFRDALERKAREGIDVRVIFDGFANMVVPAAFKRFPAVLQTLHFRPTYTPLDATSLRNWFRDHRKILVCDSDVAFVGGYNIGTVYSDGSWRDTHARLRGAGVAELRNAFVDFWNAHRPANLDPLPDVEARSWHHHVLVHRNDPYMRIFPIRGMYLEAIDRAARNIYLTHAYFIPDRAFRRALVEAAQRGVDVQVLLPWRSNHVLADWLARRFFDELMAAGVRLFAYRDIMIHAKTATIDGVWSTVGTANIDRMSLFGNYEANLEIYSERIARQMEAMFDLDKRNCFEVDSRTWRQRPTHHKLVERTLESLAPFV